MGTLTCHADLYDEAGYNPPICELSKPLDEKAMPLIILAEHLVIGPPSIGMLIDLLEQSEYVQAFLELVREYLPEHEREIMLRDYYDRAHVFISLFSERYFPIEESPFGEPEELETLVGYIPVQLGGMNYDDYHEFDNFRDEHNLLLSLVCYPYVIHDDADKGARVPLLEGAARVVGKEIAEKIPPEGWEPEQLHKWLDGTRFEGVADFADWVCSCTGTWVLDCTYDGWAPEAWDREVVDNLTAQWPKVQEITGKMNSLMDWLGDDKQANFDELLKFILRKQKGSVPKEQPPLPLGMATDEEKKKLLVDIFNEEDNEEERQPDLSAI